LGYESPTRIAELKKSALAISVGDSVFVHHENVGTEVVDTVNASTVRSAVAKVKWADVVKRPPSATAAAMCGGQGPDLHQHRKFVFRSLSQNNPVNRIKV
jgi:oligoribonuclease (3'-5' exoribonuclease)